ncbi:MAG: prepilin-type N-terminal cleavage/methylation protein [Conexibacter sp.]|nr:prepilin-type N-terminal cleavage/methylation protein [Conexibacter sp.]
MEVLVSAVLVVVFATATLSIIDKSGAAAADNRQRGVATQLAQQDQDALRLKALTTLSDYHKTTTRTIAPLKYTIQSDAVWLRDGTGQVTCSADSTRAEYVKITSKVSWVGHPAPVVLESYVSPGVKGLALGSLTVKLHNDAGVGTSGIGVTFRGNTATTDADGCAVFTALAPGTSNATWNGSGSLPNYVDRNGSNAVVQSVSIGSGQNSQVDQLFDRAGAIPVNFVDEAGNATAWNTISAAHSGIKLPTTGIRLWTQANRTSQMTANMLFPFITQYQVYAGDCTGNTPQTWDTGSASANAGMMAAPAAATSAAVPSVVPNVAVMATGDGTTTGAAVVNKPLSIEPLTSDSRMAGCSAGYKLSDGIKTDATGKASVDLPYGLYQVCMQVKTSTGDDRYARRTFFNTPDTTTVPAAVAPNHDVSPATLLPGGLTAKATSVVLNANANLAVGNSTTAGTATPKSATTTVTKNSSACQ